MSPIEHLHSVAHKNHARLISGNGERAIYGVSPPNASGAPSCEFILEISREGETVSVKEAEATLLPSFCAERHINSGGTFCLYWGEVEPTQIKDHEDAEAWWGKLLTFLLRQRSAAALRRWPGKADARAHGSEAARFQAIAEEHAAALGPKFITLLRDNRLSVGRGYRRDRITLFQDGQRMVTVLPTAQRIMTLRQRCKCEHADVHRLPLASCGDHARRLAELVLNMDGWQKAEAIFYRYLRARNQICCGTMDDCPLAKPSG